MGQQWYTRRNALGGAGGGGAPRTVQIEQEDVVIVFDQAVYAKAVEIIWKNPEERKRVVSCMGAFHIAWTLLAVIGKRFGDAGLRDVLI